MALTLGTGIQNLPEGLAVSMLLRREGMWRGKSFAYGQASVTVEPVAGIIGALSATIMEPLLPFVLSFAADAMIFVVAE